MRTGLPTSRHRVDVGNEELSIRVAPAIVFCVARPSAAKTSATPRGTTMPSSPSKDLVVVPNPHPNRVYDVVMNCPEFTTLCPMTGQPDFATFVIEYQPGDYLVELKSLKLYLWSFRDEGHFHEDVTNIILNDFVAAAKPRYAKVIGDFSVRGGISTKVTVSYKRDEL